MPPAARISDMHVCPVHGPGVEVTGSPDVIVGFMPQGRVGDILVCAPPDAVANGSPTVIVNHRRAARIGDPTAHNGKIVVGFPTVLIGDSGQGSTLKNAAASGAPFCEECEKARAAGAPPPPPVVVPPPDAATMADASRAAIADSPEALAAKPNATPDDGLNAARRLARARVAYEFYDKEIPGLSAAEIASHIRGIDLDEPVEVIAIDAGTTVYQRGFPGGGNGQYFFLDPSTTPEQGGAHSEVLVKGPPRKLVPRDFREMTVHNSQTLKGLKSTSAPIDDTWSVSYESAVVTDKGQKVTSIIGTDGSVSRVDKKDPGVNHRSYAAAKFCEGGGTQVMIPRKQQARASTKVL